MTINVNAETLETAADFPALDCTVAFNNSNWEDLYQNLCKVWCWWGMVEKVLTRTGVVVRARAILYKAFVQMLLLYGSESWVVTG